MDERQKSVLEGITSVNMAVVAGYIFVTANRPWNAQTFAAFVITVVAFAFTAYRSINAFRSANRSAHGSCQAADDASESS